MPNPFHFIATHQDVAYPLQQDCFSEHRLSVAKGDVEFYQKQFDRWQHVAKLGIRTALFDLMNSGISHRRYLKFIRSLEA